MITLKGFINEAKSVMESSSPLAQKQEQVGALLVELSKRPDLTTYAVPIGHSDATTQTYLLWREGMLGLVIGAFDPRYSSPVHDHRNFWIIGCGYRGVDRWDMYERLDDGTKPGYSKLEQVGERIVAPQKWAVVPPPPRSIHQHNNITDGIALELLFSYGQAPDPTERLLYDVAGNTHWESPFRLTGIYTGANIRPRCAAAFPKPLTHAYTRCLEV